MATFARALVAVLIVLGALGVGLVTVGSPVGITNGDFLFGGDDGPEVVMEAADSPNAERYVTRANDGQVEINVTEVGVNVDAQTTLDDLIVIENRGSQAVGIWLSHDSGAVAFYPGSDADGSLEGEENLVWLGEDERILAGARLDTTGMLAPGDLEPTVTVNAKFGSFHVDSLAVPDGDLTVGETLSANVTVRNEGGETSAEPIRFLVDGEPVDNATGELAPGESDQFVFEYIVTESDVGENGSELEVGIVTPGDEASATVNTTVPAEPEFSINAVTPEPETVTAGGEVTAVADIENTGDLAGEQTVELLVDGDLVDEQTVNLTAGGEMPVELDYATAPEDVGERELTVRTDDDEATAAVTVEESTEAEFDVADLSADGTVVTGERIGVGATVENVGEEAGEQTVRFRVDGETVDSERVALDVGDTERVNFGYRVVDSEAFTVSVASDDGQENATVAVDAPEVNARGTANRLSALLGSEVTLSADRTVLVGAENVTYEWAIDGEPIGTGRELTTAVIEPGARDVRLTVTAETAGGTVTDTDSFTISVTNPGPSAVLDGPGEGAVGEALEFDATASVDGAGGTAGLASYEWEFNDGTTASGDTVTHTYDEPGTYTVTLTVTDSFGDVDTATSTVTVEGPNGTVPSTRLAFGEVSVGSTVGLSVPVTNDGNAVLRIDDVALTGDNGAFELAGDAGSSLTVRPGETITVPVNFSPNGTGTENATLAFETQRGSLPAVDLTGTGVEGSLSPVDSTVSFEQVPVGGTAEATVEVENTGENPVTLAGADVDGDDAGDFTLSSELPGTVDAGERVSLTVEFAPTTSSDRSATLRISGAETAATVSLRGTGGAPAINLPSGVDFGGIGFESSDTKGVEIRNYGSQTLTVDNLSITGDGAEQFSVGGAPAEIAPGENASVELGFDPSGQGEYNATLEIESNDPNGTSTVPVSGRAVGGQIEVPESALDFGDVQVGTSVSLNVTVTNQNRSPAPLTVDEAQIVGSHPDSFDVVGGGPEFTLQPGESRDLEVEFTAPNNAGAVREAQLQILSNAENAPLINVWLANTRTYIVVQEISNPTVNVQGRNVVEGSSHDVNVWTPTVEEQATAGFENLSFSATADGDMELNVDHDRSPHGPAFEGTDSETAIEYVELEHLDDLTETSGESYSDTQIRYHVNRADLPDGTQPDEVTLYRRSGGEWNELTERTTLIRQTATHFYYRVETPGFSQFVATGPPADGGDETGDPNQGDGTSDPGGTGDSDGGGGDGSDDPDDGTGGEPGDGQSDDDPGDGTGEDPDGGTGDGPDDDQTDDWGGPVAVEFGDEGGSDGVETTELTVDELRELERETADRPPIAAAAATLDAETSLRAPTEQTSVTIGGAEFSIGPDTEVTTVGESIRLSGERSLIGSSDAVTASGRIGRVVDITVPEERRGERATVRISVARDRFGELPPEEAVVGHYTEEGWRLLETTVVGSTGDSVVLAAETDGFSPFAVFVSPDVEYEWQLPDGDTQSGRALDSAFDEPGVYSFELTVTDALGRQDTSTRRVLVDDVPSAEIVTDGVTDDGELRLVADVTNEVGNTTVRWTFPDGTEAVGREVTRELPDGEHEIRLAVEDEFGASTEVEETIAVGPQSIIAETVSVILAGPTMLIPAAVALGAIMVLVTAYRRIRIPWYALRRDGEPEPRITRLEEPFVDSERDQFGFGTVTVDDPLDDLDAITVELTDRSGDVLARERLDVPATSRYTPTDESIVLESHGEIPASESYSLRIQARNSRDFSAEAAVTDVPDRR